MAKRFAVKRILYLAFVLSMLCVAVSLPKAINSRAKLITAYDLEMGLNIVPDGNGDLALTTTDGAAGYEYQYWAKEKVPTDSSAESKATQQFLWQCVRDFDTDNTCDLTPDKVYEDANGRYSIIVRVRDSNKNMVNEIYRTYTLKEVGYTVITDIVVNDVYFEEDYIVVNKDNPLKIKAIAANATNYKLIHKDSILPSSSGEWDNVDIGSFSAGLHEIIIECEGVNTYRKSFSIYVYDSYSADTTPVIEELDGVSNPVGLTTFTMKVRYADQRPITGLLKDNYIYTLQCLNKTYFPTNKTPNADGFLYVDFEIDYGKNMYGIYELTGRVSRLDNFEDDKIIKFYYGYSRSETAYIEQLSDVDLIDGIYTANKNDTIQITAEGYIKRADNSYVPEADLRYAFFREDASGWVLIKNYGESNDGALSWIPQRAGTYRIITRIKDANAGSYEKETMRTYNILGTDLTGSLTLNLYAMDDTNLNNPVTNPMTGIPYRLKAGYEVEGESDEIDNILYMFTLSSKNLGGIYLNHYTTDSNYIFIPHRPDDFYITARVINAGNFGFMDLASQTLKVTSIYSDILSAAPENIALNNTVLSWDSVFNATSYVIEIKDTASAVNEIAVQGLSYDIGGYLTVGGKYEIRIKSVSATGTSAGYGNVLEIYAISDKAEFIGIASNYRTKHNILIADIDLGGQIYQSESITSISTGVFDGNGYKVYNFSIKPNYWGWAALFGTSLSGTIRNVSIYCDTYQIAQGGSSAIVTVAVESGGVIDNVFVSVENLIYPEAGLSPAGNNGYASIIAQSNYYGTIKNCVEVANWSSLNSDPENTNGFNRIARNQQGGIFENNYSMINNAPEEMANNSGSKIISYSQNDIAIETGETTALAALAGYTLEFVSDNQAAAQVNPATGEVNAAASGTATITVYFKKDGAYILANGQRLSKQIKVNVFDTPTSPENIAFNGTVVSWKSAFGAENYVIEIKNTAGTVSEVTAQGLSYDIGANLPAGGKYEIRIKSVSATGTSAGYGNALEIYAISNKAEFIGIKGNSNTKHNILIADINLGGQMYGSESITSITTGVLDGNGYKVYNFGVNKTGWGWFSMFGGTLSGTIKNLSIFCGSFDMTHGSNAIVATAVVSGGVIDNVFVSVENLIYPAAGLTPAGNNGYASIIAQNNYFGTIKNCIETANWSSLNSDPENTNGFNRIARNQQGGIFENNYSMINNAPEEMANNSGSKIISYSQSDITTTAGATVTLAALAGYTLEFVSDNQAAAQVNPATGEVNAAASGTANITVYFKKDGAYISANGQKLSKQIKVNVT